MIPKKILFLSVIILLLTTAGYWLSCREKAVPDSGALETAGRYLFYDTRLSFNNTKSCASCHAPQWAFTDGYRRSITATGQNVLHNAPSLLNIALHKRFDWANPAVTSLETQHQRPLFSTQPVELGAGNHQSEIVQLLRQDTLYQRLFAAAFPGQSGSFDFEHIVSAIAAFVRSLQSLESPYDHYLAGDSNALSYSARAGLQLFSTLHCNTCHGGLYFTNATLTASTDSLYFNTGLYNVNNTHRYPADDNGLAAFTLLQKDDGRFKVPTLRNVAATAPYMHDGSVATLPEVIDLYGAGGRLTTTGPLAGNGRLNKYKHPLLQSFTLTPLQKQQLIDFLYALTDSAALQNPAFQSPFTVPAFY